MRIRIVACWNVKSGLEDHGKLLDELTRTAIPDEETASAWENAIRESLKEIGRNAATKDEGSSGLDNTAFVNLSLNDVEQLSSPTGAISITGRRKPGPLIPFAGGSTKALA